MKQNLEKEGYFPSFVQESNGRYKVLIGKFKKRSTARKLCQALQADGYSASVITADFE